MALKQAKPIVTHDYIQSLNRMSSNNEAITNNNQINEFQWPKKTRILVVEDNRINQMVATGILNKLGLTADVAGNGIEAIELLKSAELSDRFSLILMDCQMPEMDGYQASTAIRDNAAGQDNQLIPIIAMTANAMQGDKEKCLDAGMSDYLTKPIEPNLLQDKLKQWLLITPKHPERTLLRNQSKQPSDDKIKKIDLKVIDESSKEINKKSSPPTESTSDEELAITWDKAACLNRVRDNKKLLNMLIDAFIEDMPERFDELEQAIKSNNYKQIHYIAHAIKGIAGNLSALEIQQQSALLESAAKEQEDTKITELNNTLVQAYQLLIDEFSTYQNADK